MGNDATAAPRYIRIADWLRTRIDEGTYAPLERVPSEIVLARRFEVSRETVRNALERLEAEGYLFRRAGKGTFVAARRIEHPGSTQASFSATLQALGLAHTTKVLTAQVLPADHHVARALGLASATPVVTVRRLRLVEGEPVALHTTCLPERYRSILEHDLTGSLQELLVRSGVPIVGSRDSLQAVHADEEDARILGVRISSPLLRIEGVGIDASGTPQRHTDSLYRGDRLRIRHDTQAPSGISWELRSATRRRATSDPEDEAMGRRAGR